MAFMGMRGTGDWSESFRPENWREMVLYLYPNGSAPLTAMLSMLGSEATDDAHFHWFTQTMGSVNGAVTNIYTDSVLASAYTTGGVAGSRLYVVVTDSDVYNSIRAGHQLLLRDQSDLDVDVNAKVIDKYTLGTSYVLVVKLLEADDNSASHDLSDCDYLCVIGNINAEGAEMPDAVSFDPIEYENYTQIFRTPLDITRTARKTKLRTGDAYQKMKKEALEMHSIEMELAFLFSIMTLGTGDNGKPERTTRGLIPFLKQYASSNNSCYTTDTDFSGDTWLVGGEDWLNTRLEAIFRYGSSEKMAFAGSGALLGMNRLAKAGAQITMTPTTESYGISVSKWVTPFGTLNVKTHPLFSYDPTNRNSLVIFEPENLKERVLDNTIFFDDKEKQNTGHNRIDGTKEEYLTETGLEYHFPQTGGILTGLNQDNSL